MDNSKQHWPILGKLGTDLENKVRSFLVIGVNGDGLIVATKDGLAYWIGKIQFGFNGESRTATIPTQLNRSGLISMAQGYSYILLLNKQGEIYSMGKNHNGQLGLGSFDLTQTHFSPQLISSSHKFTSIRCGYWHSLALTKDGKVWAWGLNNWRQVGVPSSTVSFPSPRQISELDHHRVVAVECGGCHSLALTDKGEVYAWGNNYCGQLGNGSQSTKHIPIQIINPSPVQSMAAGLNHTLLLTKTGEVYACGSNEYGQLGLPTTTKSSPHLSKVAGLPPISQIASHPLTRLSIAMSPNHLCFVWGEFADKTSNSTPRELPSEYSTVESPLSSFSTNCRTPHSIPVSARECSSRTDSTTLTELCPDSVANQTPTYRILEQMFNNSDSSPNVRFQVGDQTILAHRSVLQISSGRFRQLFSTPSAELIPLSSATSQFGPSHSRHTTNPSEPEPNSLPHCSPVTIPIPDHSYPAFHAYLRFLYLGILEVPPEHLADLFSLSVAYLESDLQQLCLSRMRTTITPATCCLYYQSINRHSLPELSAFQQELVQFISTKFQEVIRTSAYQSMDDGLCKKLTISMANLHIN